MEQTLNESLSGSDSLSQVSSLDRADLESQPYNPIDPQKPKVSKVKNHLRKRKKKKETPAAHTRSIFRRSFDFKQYKSSLEAKIRLHANYSDDERYEWSEEPPQSGSNPLKPKESEQTGPVTTHKHDPSEELKQVQPKKERFGHRKRFSKKTLELISRQFSDYYGAEVSLREGGPSLRSIGRVFELGHATVHKLYAEWMEDPCFYERIRRYDHFRHKSKHPQKRLTIERLNHIGRLIKENPFLTQSEICVQINKIEDLKSMKNGERQIINRTVVSKLLRMGKFRKKRVKCIPKEKNTSKSIERRQEYCVKYKAIVERGARVYFLDESGFNLYMSRDKAWSRPNEEVTVNCPISKGKRFSLIAIIGDDGLAHWRFIQGTYRKYEYLDFIRELFQKLSQHRQEGRSETWLVMDNCAIHDKQQTHTLAAQHHANVLYLPSYSPQLNPIENWFHQVKCKLRKVNYSGEHALASIMERLLKQYEDHDFTNYFSASLKFVEKGIRGEKF